MATNTTLSIAATTPFTTRLGGTNSDFASNVKSVGVKFTSYETDGVVWSGYAKGNETLYLIQDGKNTSRFGSVTGKLNVPENVGRIGLSLLVNDNALGKEQFVAFKCDDKSSRLLDHTLSNLTGHVVQEYSDEGTTFKLTESHAYSQTMCERITGAVLDSASFAGNQLSRLDGATGGYVSAGYNRMPSRASLSERGQQAWGAVSSRLPSWKKSANSSADSKKKQ